MYLAKISHLQYNTCTCLCIYSPWYLYFCVMNENPCNIHVCFHDILISHHIVDCAYTCMCSSSTCAWQVSNAAQQNLQSSSLAGLCNCVHGVSPLCILHIAPPGSLNHEIHYNYTCLISVGV